MSEASSEELNIIKRFARKCYGQLLTKNQQIIIYNLVTEPGYRMSNSGHPHPVDMYRVAQGYAEVRGYIQ